MADIAAGGAQESFDFGRVVGQTFSLIGRNFALLVSLALVFVGIPQFGLLYAQSYVLANQGIGGMWQVTLIRHHGHCLHSAGRPHPCGG